MRQNESRRATMGHFLENAVCLEWHARDFGHLPFPVQRRSAAKDTAPGHTADGEALYSWRAVISDRLMDWGQDGDWDRVQAWNASANRALLRRSPFYAFGASPATSPSAAPEAFPTTNIVAIVGPGTAFGDGTQEPLRLDELPRAALLLVESRQSDIPWPSPGDFDVRTMPRTIDAPDGRGISGCRPGGFCVLFADGRVWFLSNKTPFETLARFFTLAGAKAHDREELLGPYALERWKRRRDR